ncbi:MAG: hypothetical protein NPIRA02_37520 [Nitrospirales bacterium]|nr:MAG: hypothetical protein NPIRA02_37520 [Nitrospirales bacterium]
MMGKPPAAGPLPEGSSARLFHRIDYKNLWVGLAYSFLIGQKAGGEKPESEKSWEMICIRFYIFHFELCIVIFTIRCTTGTGSGSRYFDYG